jgi:hypothetical protein
MPLNENLVYEANLKLGKFITIKGPIRKISKLLAVLSEGLD